MPLLPFLVLIARLSADREIMGRYRSGPVVSAAYVALIGLVTLAVLALATTPLW